MKLRVHVNRILDRIVGSRLARSPNAWFACIVAGASIGIALASLVAWTIGYSPWLTGGLAAGLGLSCLALALVRKIWTGEENYVFYHYLLFVIGVSMLLLIVLEWPILVYLDLIVLAWTVTHAVGRVGCLLAGCCHGKPHDVGVCYGIAQVGAGFPTYSAGIRFFPLQALESLFGFILTVGMVSILLAGLPPGAASAVYLGGYSSVRFFLEFSRGDSGRPYYGSLSQSQWVSLILVSLVTAGAAAGVLPSFVGVAGAASLLVIFANHVLNGTQPRAEVRRLSRPNGPAYDE